MIVHKDQIIGDIVFIHSHVTTIKQIDNRMTPVIVMSVLIREGAKIPSSESVEDDTVVGANAVVIKNVSTGSIMVGKPAKEICQ